jgi:homocysteine S-methyltransferase
MEKPSFVCFVCKNGKEISSGESIREAVKLVQGLKNVIAVGVHCTKPKFILELIGEVKKET